MDKLSLFWLILTIILVIIEAATPALVCIWLAAGALITFVFSFLDIPLWAQISIFVASSVALVIATRPLAKKYVYKKSIATNADRIIGAEGIVTNAIDSIENTGQVKIMGQIWSAKSHNGAPIPKDTLVSVVNLEGVKAVVKEK